MAITLVECSLCEQQDAYVGAPAHFADMAQVEGWERDEAGNWICPGCAEEAVRKALVEG